MMKVESPPAEKADQLVVFELGEGRYGIDISRVMEIIGVPSITRVPGTPSYVKGIINLRGRVIPVIDLALRLGSSGGGLDRERKIIVVEADGDTVGMLVDGVSEVVHVSTSDLEPPSPIMAGSGSGPVRELAKTSNGLVSVLDLEKALDIPS